MELTHHEIGSKNDGGFQIWYETSTTQELHKALILIVAKDPYKTNRLVQLNQTRFNKNKNTENIMLKAPCLRTFKAQI